MPLPVAASRNDPQRRSNTTEHFQLGRVLLTRHRNSTTPHQSLPNGASEDIWVTFAYPADRGVHNGVTVIDSQSRFVLERGDNLQAFTNANATDFWTLKMPVDLLKQRLRSLDRYISHEFDAEAGMGGLLSDIVRLLPGRVAEADADARASIGISVIDILAAAVQSDAGVLDPPAPSVQIAHQTRIERFIRNNLADRSLSPETIAAHCGISVRYLHRLAAGTGPSISCWIRELRLAACERQLRNGRAESIAEIAYRWGFGDQAQFSRHFRARFGCTPSQHRQRTRPSAA